MSRAQFQSRLVDGVIVAHDLATTDNALVSITNDAEAVTTYLVEQFGDRLIVYRDSQGNYDELQHVAGRFIGFGLYHGTELHDTLERVQRAHNPHRTDQ